MASASSSSASFEPRLSPAIALSAALAALPPIIYWYRVAGSVRKRLDEEEKEREQERERERARLEKLRRLRGSERATNDGTRPFSLHLSLARFSSFFTRLFFSQKKSRKACICKKKKGKFFTQEKEFQKEAKNHRSSSSTASQWLVIGNRSAATALTGLNALPFPPLVQRWTQSEASVSGLQET